MSVSELLHVAEGTGRPLGLIAGIGLTEVHVYSQRPAPDGLFSGCPHVHAVCDEAYFVLRGHGRVEFHDLEHGFRQLELHPGDYVHFSPLILHRLISQQELVILGMMANVGLAERGEARIYFGPEVDQDPARFEHLVRLPAQEGLAGALERRDAAVRGYMGLLELWQRDRSAYEAELRRFLHVHCQAMARKAGELLDQVQRGPLAWAQRTAARIQQLPALPAGTPEVWVHRAGSSEALGMCGQLRPVTAPQLLP